MTAKHPSESYGKNADRIFEDLMGMKTIRPEKVKARLEHIYDLISDAELDSAKRDIEHVLSELITLAGSRLLRQELTLFLANAPNINL